MRANGKEVPCIYFLFLCLHLLFINLYPEVGCTYMEHTHRHIKGGIKFFEFGKSMVGVEFASNLNTIALYIKYFRVLYTFLLSNPQRI